jgi:alpha-mannosidase
MAYDDLIILIPSHSLEDFPAELGEDDAASLLNSFAVAWHPALLADAKVLPRWHRADDPPDVAQKRLILIPTCCESRLPPGWADRVAGEGGVLVRGLSERAAMAAAALAPLAVESPFDPELVADFLALGLCHLEIELLTRKMRHFSNLDEVHLQREAVAAAEAALAHDAETARTRLRACFEALAGARERFYPVDCYLIDLCLVIPRLADQHFRNALAAKKPLSVLASAIDLEEIADKAPESSQALRDAIFEGVADLVCGDLCERPLPLLPLESVLWQLAEADRITNRLFSKHPVVWGRRRYGVFPLLPQILKKAGFQAALHVVLDDGIYPDSEHSKFRWEGTGGTSIDAWSRIPLAAEAALSFLRFPDRMSESMDNDHVAAVTFARWPEVKSPFFDDLRRIHTYAPVLGRFVTFSEFFTATDTPTRHASYRPGEYLTPYLFQAAAREEENAISRFTGHVRRRARFDSAVFLAGLQRLLVGRAPDAQATAALERDSELLGDHPAAEAVAPVEERIEHLVSQSAAEVARLIVNRTDDRPGYLVLNTLGFRRTVSVPLDPAGPVPRTSGEGQWLQWEQDRHAMTVDVPGAGFVWVAAEGTPPAPPAVPAPALAVADQLRNEMFEVHLNETTGGIAQIKGYGRSPNRLSQQLNFRYSRERSFTVGTGSEAEEIRSHYAEMRRLTSTVTCTGPALGEIVTTGEIVDQKSQKRLAGYRQTVRVWRGRPVVEIDVELSVDEMPDGEPWHNYFAARFAWHDETASVTRSAMMGAHETAEERIESLHYLEIATPEQRTTILAPGLAFHRKTGPRMIDTILIPARETERKFRFVIAVDQDYPMQSALDALTPPIVVPPQAGPPKSGSAGWFFHLASRQVQIIRMLPLVSSVAPESDVGQVEHSDVGWVERSEAHQVAGNDLEDRPVASRERQLPDTLRCGCALRLVETEGRPIRARLRCFRTPASARQRDFLGNTICELPIDGDAILVDLAAYEIADIETRFN